MREIKFRAWDKKGLVMTPYFAMIGGVPMRKNYDGIYFDESNYLEVMQFTGLKDKNGKEIYEGDIVENYALKDVVVFVNGVFTTKNAVRDKFGCKQSLFVHDNLKIVDNIYEKNT